jgi:hypothetical protein
MPLENLEGYGSDFCSSIQSRNCGTVPKYGQQDCDSNATASESEDDSIMVRIGAKKIDGQYQCDYGEGDSFF